MSKTLESNQQIYLEHLKKMRLMDDTLMSAVFRNKECTQLLLRIILNNDSLVVTDVNTQKILSNLHGRGVRFDITAHDADGKLYNVEVQRNDYGAVPKRARYNSGMLDSNITVAGETYDELPESYVIFITENDVFKKGFPLYHIERVIQETGTLFSDDAHIIYVNGAYSGQDPIGDLMHDFRCLDASEMKYSLLAREMRWYKEIPGGVTFMCKIMEDLAIQSSTKARAESVFALIKKQGLSPDTAMDVLDVPTDERDVCRKLVDAMLTE